MKPLQNPSNTCANKYPPILLATLAISSAGALCLLATVLLVRYANTRVSLPLLLACIGGIGALIGLRLPLAIWWFPILLLFPAALAGALYLAIPGWIYLVLFILLLVIYWNAAISRVPLYLTNPRTWQAILEITRGAGQDFVDLGCGFGGLLVYLGRQRPDMKFVGVESAPLPYLIAKLRIILSGTNNVDIRYRDFWDFRLTDFDIVYAFLSPDPMPRLYRKVEQEMCAGSLFISNSFVVDGHPPDETIDVDDHRQTRLNIWKQ